MTLRRTKLATMSAKRRAEYEAQGVRPTSTFKPKPPKMATAKRKDTGPDKATVDAVRARDRGRCTCCGDPAYGERGRDWSISHRKLRAQGVDNRLSNLMLSCGNGVAGCEGWIHAHPERARQAGWMLLSTENPEEKPVEHSQHGLVLLLDDGTWQPVEVRRDLA